MRFETIFPETENIHLMKDVGMIPYFMYKNFGYESKIVCYENGEYSYLENEVRGLKIQFLKKYTNISILDGAIYLLKNSNDIDILNLYHFSIRTALWVLIYKKINKLGKVYVKLDSGGENRDISKISLKNIIKKYILKNSDLVSVESKELYEYSNKNWPAKVELIPNGFSSESEIRPLMPNEKENYIITVGRIGTKQKASEILLESIAQIYSKIPGWKVKLIGPIEEKFKPYIKDFFERYPQLQETVIFTGAIYDRRKLDDEYRKAKIFCLPSLYESFGIVLVEAIKNGCYIISSDLPPVYDITSNCKYGEIFKVGDTDKLAQLLLKNCNNDKYDCSMQNEIQQFAYKNYDWKVICGRISRLLNE